MAKVNTHNNKVGHSELVGTLPVIATIRISLSTATDGTESILFQVTITDRHNVYGNVQMICHCAISPIFSLSDHSHFSKHKPSVH